MAPTPRPTDPRRELLRRQAILRRQSVFDRLAATRSIMIGSVITVSCVLVGYLDANAHPHRVSTLGTGPLGVFGTTGGGTGGAGSSTAGSSNVGSGNVGGSPAASGSQGQPAVVPPSASSGGGVVISGGS